MAKESVIARESGANPRNAVRGGYMGVGTRTLAEGGSTIYTQDKAMRGIRRRATRLMERAMEQGLNTERVRRAFKSMMSSIGL